MKQFNMICINLYSLNHKTTCISCHGDYAAPDASPQSDMVLSLVHFGRRRSCGWPISARPVQCPAISVDFCWFGRFVASCPGDSCRLLRYAEPPVGFSAPCDVAPRLRTLSAAHLDCGAPMLTAQRRESEQSWIQGVVDWCLKMIEHDWRCRLGSPSWKHIVETLVMQTLFQEQLYHPKYFRTALVSVWLFCKSQGQHWYPLVIQHNYGKSPCLMGKSTINGHFQ